MLKIAFLAWLSPYCLSRLVLVISKVYNLLSALSLFDFPSVWCCKYKNEFS